jgi:hypothetical protein
VIWRNFREAALLLASVGSHWLTFLLSNKTSSAASGGLVRSLVRPCMLTSETNCDSHSVPKQSDRATAVTVAVVIPSTSNLEGSFRRYPPQCHRSQWQVKPTCNQHATNMLFKFDRVSIHEWRGQCSGGVSPGQQPRMSKPSPEAQHAERDAFICAKYVHREFCAAEGRLPGGSAQAALWEAARYGDVRYAALL